MPRYSVISVGLVREGGVQEMEFFKLLNLPYFKHHLELLT